MDLHSRQLIGCINKEFWVFLIPGVRTRQLSIIVKKKKKKDYTDTILRTLLSKNKNNIVFPLKRVT